MKIIIEEAAKEFILKNEGHVRVLTQSCYSGGG